MRTSPSGYSARIGANTKIFRVCKDPKCDKLHMSNMHHYGCECFGCMHEYWRLKRG